MTPRYTIIEWDEHNIDKNETHGVFYTEINAAFENTAHIRRGKKHPTEKRMFLYGVTDSGRYLFIVFQDKGKGIARPISARDMRDFERRIYEESI